MPTSDPIEILLAQNRWAMRNLLGACESLSDEQLHQRFEMGPGSLHDTITHILAAMQGWGDMLAGREQRPRLEGTQRSLKELGELLETISDDMEASARAHPLDELVTGSRGGRTFTFTRGAVLTHVLTHGMHHRAQCLNMLRQLGVDRAPPSAVVEWVLTVDAAG
ncbi:MAG: DinB family protein [Planctomycetota bacterium]|jgi:uncharacterized damage-inducible protein DinB